MPIISSQWNKNCCWNLLKNVSAHKSYGLAISRKIQFSHDISSFEYMLRVYYIFVISKRTLTKINFIVKVLSFHKKIKYFSTLGHWAGIG